MAGINFKYIGDYLTKHDLWAKSLENFSALEIERLCEIVHEATSPEAGFEPPRIEKGGLIIPFRAPVKYRWWQGGQSILKTLEEIGASEDVKSKYTPSGHGKEMPKT